MVNLTTKERLLLNDEKSHEELCIKKYSKAASEAQDPQLKQLFTTLGQHEQQHLDTINSIISGNVPNINTQGQQGGQNQSAQPPTPSSTSSQSGYNQKDADLCQDALSTEKYVSSTYNTTIFEVTDHNIRQVLNHIQKEEQEHGEQIYNYMASKGYYQPS